MRKNLRIQPVEQHIHYGIKRAFSEYKLGMIDRARYVEIVEYLS